jgi:hypothetical protein
VMQPQTEISENFPFEACLAVGHMLRLEVRDFCAEDRPNAEVLVLCRPTVKIPLNVIVSLPHTIP